jgi:hypothetical protein
MTYVLTRGEPPRNEEVIFSNLGGERSWHIFDLDKYDFGLNSELNNNVLKCALTLVSENEVYAYHFDFNERDSSFEIRYTLMDGEVAVKEWGQLAAICTDEIAAQRSIDLTELFRDGIISHSSLLRLRAKFTLGGRNITFERSLQNVR